MVLRVYARLQRLGSVGEEAEEEVSSFEAPVFWLVVCGVGGRVVQRAEEGRVAAECVGGRRGGGAEGEMDGQAEEVTCKTGTVLRYGPTRVICDVRYPDTRSMLRMVL
eukprot:490079-Rhodomonas_salina.1